MKLSMNYYTVYDMRQENATVNPVFEELLATTNGVIDKLLSGQAEDVTEVETVRNRLIETMEVVTQYVDCLRIYEYVSVSYTHLDVYKRQDRCRGTGGTETAGKKRTAGRDSDGTWRYAVCS